MDATKSTTEEFETITLFINFLNRKVYIGSRLGFELQGKLIKFLEPNTNCFAWSHADMKSIPPKVMAHKLNLNPLCVQVKQTKRKVKHPDWLANILVVPKKNAKWILCLDYTKLNKVCSNDCFPLPNIDQLMNF